MGVVLFQSFIVITLLAAGRYRLYAALAWSAFTLFMVFMPWLLVLQLIVIWGTYSVAGEDEGRAGGEIRAIAGSAVGEWMGLLLTPLLGCLSLIGIGIGLLFALSLVFAIL